MTANQLNAVQGLIFNSRPTASSPLIINVDAPGTFDWNVPNFSGIGDPEGRHIILNFYNSNTINLNGSSTITGTLFAPQAHVNKNIPANVNGQMIAKSYIHQNGELHHHPFDANITLPACREICNNTTTTITANVTNQSNCSNSCCTRTVSNTTQCDNGNFYVFYLSDGNNNRHYQRTNNSAVSWQECDDGTVHYTATNLMAIDGSGEIISLDFNYSGKTTTEQSDGHKTHYCNNNYSEAGWYYYPTLAGTITSNQNGTFSATRRGKAFQMGRGANATSNNLDFGGSGWVHIMLSEQCSESTTGGNNNLQYLWSTGATAPSIEVNSPGQYRVTVSDCQGCKAIDVITVDSDNCDQDCNLIVNIGQDQVVCDNNATLTAAISGKSNCTSIGQCDLANNATELIRWNMNNCDPAGLAGSEDCNTNGPTIISRGGCANISATAPCNNAQLDFSCNNGQAGGGGIMPL